MLKRPIVRGLSARDMSPEAAEFVFQVLSVVAEHVTPIQFSAIVESWEAVIAEPAGNEGVRHA